MSFDYEDVLKNWKKYMHEVSFKKCVLIMQLLCHVVTEIVELPIYEGILELSRFLMEFQEKVAEPQQLLVLEEALKATPAHWWVTHKK